MINRMKIVSGVVGVVVLAVVVFTLWALFGGSKWATASVGIETYTFRLADSPIERAKGLSGMSIGDLNADGMLFVFPDDATRLFTMRGMEFPLDFIWIRDNKIMHIDYGVDEGTVDSTPILADMVIEVPAGHAQEMNFQIGHPIAIDLDAKAAK